MPLGFNFIAREFVKGWPTCVTRTPDEVFDLFVLELDAEIFQHDFEFIGVDAAVLVRVDEFEGRP